MACIRFSHPSSEIWIRRLLVGSRGILNILTVMTRSPDTIHFSSWLFYFFLNCTFFYLGVYAWIYYFYVILIFSVIFLMFSSNTMVTLYLIFSLFNLTLSSRSNLLVFLPALVRLVWSSQLEEYGRLARLLLDRFMLYLCEMHIKSILFRTILMIYSCLPILILVLKSSIIRVTTCFLINTKTLSRLSQNYFKF